MSGKRHKAIFAVQSRGQRGTPKAPAWLRPIAALPSVLAHTRKLKRSRPPIQCTVNRFILAGHQPAGTALTGGIPIANNGSNDAVSGNRNTPAGWGPGNGPGPALALSGNLTGGTSPIQGGSEYRDTTSSLTIDNSFALRG